MGLRLRELVINHPYIWLLIMASRHIVQMLHVSIISVNNGSPDILKRLDKRKTAPLYVLWGRSKTSTIHLLQYLV